MHLRSKLAIAGQHQGAWQQWPLPDVEAVASRAVAARGRPRQKSTGI